MWRQNVIRCPKLSTKKSLIASVYKSWQNLGLRWLWYQNVFHSNGPERSAENASKTKYNFPNPYPTFPRTRRTLWVAFLCSLIPDLWREQSVHWETRLGLEGLKRLLARYNPNQRDEPSKVTPHLTKRKTGLQWTGSHLSTNSLQLLCQEVFTIIIIIILTYRHWDKSCKCTNSTFCFDILNT